MSDFPFYRAIVDLTEDEHDRIVDAASSGETISETVKRLALLLASPMQLSGQIIYEPKTALTDETIDRLARAIALAIRTPT